MSFMCKQYERDRMHEKLDTFSIIENVILEVFQIKFFLKIKSLKKKK